MWHTSSGTARVVATTLLAADTGDTQGYDKHCLLTGHTPPRPPGGCSPRPRRRSSRGPSGSSPPRCRGSRGTSCTPPPPQGRGRGRGRPRQPADPGTPPAAGKGGYSGDTSSYSGHQGASGAGGRGGGEGVGQHAGQGLDVLLQGVSPPPHQTGAGVPAAPVQGPAAAGDLLVHGDLGHVDGALLLVHLLAPVLLHRHQSISHVMNRIYTLSKQYLYTIYTLYTHYQHTIYTL